MYVVSYYIQETERLDSFQTVDMPLEAEVNQAVRVLSHSPVSSYPPFTVEEVRIIGKYREFLSPRRITYRTDDFWDAIVSNEWYAWLIAVHEAAEINALTPFGINPFDAQQFDALNTLNNTHFTNAHMEASLFELQYIQAWGQQLKYNVPLVAIAAQHPINKSLNPNYQQFVKTLQALKGWPDPMQEDITEALNLWSAIRQRQIVP